MGCNFYDSIKWCPGAVLKRTIWLLSDFKRYFTYLFGKICSKKFVGAFLCDAMLG